MSKPIRLAVILTACLTALTSVQLAYRFLQPPIVYRKDFVSPYLMAKAIVSGENPYTEISELTTRYIPEAPLTPFPHPTPHPFALGLLFLPLAALDYRAAVFVWHAAQVALLFCCALRIRSVLAPSASRLLACAVGVVFLSAGPLIEELCSSQVNLLLLALLCSAWIDLRGGREFRGGLWLGLVFALKMMAWPIVIFLALRRRWRAVIPVCAVVAGANLLAGVVMGFGYLWDYYMKIGPRVSAIYRMYDANFSAYALGRRLFEGVGTNFLTGLESPPLWASPTLTTLGGIIAPLAVLLFGLWLAIRANDFDSAFGALVCTSLLVNPITWGHYLILAAVPSAIIAARLSAAKFPRWPSLKFGIVVCLLLIPRTMVLLVAERFVGLSEEMIIVPPLVAFILTAFRAFAALALASLAGIHIYSSELAGIHIYSSDSSPGSSEGFSEGNSTRS